MRKILPLNLSSPESLIDGLGVVSRNGDGYVGEFLRRDGNYAVLTTGRRIPSDAWNFYVIVQPESKKTVPV